jgi:hypothetical protein
MNQPLITIARLLLLGLSALAASLAEAQVTYQVNTVADLIDSNTSDGVCNTSANNCSLRAALMQTNARVEAGRIDILLPPGVYLLTRPISGANGADSGGLNLTAPLGVNQDVFLTGAGATNTIIDGNQLDGVLQIDGRQTQVRRLTIRNGNRLNPGTGGGIYTRASTLEIFDCVIERNRSNRGGGLYVEFGTVFVTRSTLRANSALLGGGAYVKFGAFPFFSFLYVYESAIHQNLALNGAGIFTSGSGEIRNSTISSNYADINGGGIYAEAFNDIRISSSSIIGNDSDHDRDQTGGVGGGIYVVNSSYPPKVTNTLIAGNTNLGFFDDDCVGSLDAFGRNLFGRLEGCSIANTAAQGLVAPDSIGPLQDNGGPTLTHALLLGSAAINGTLGSLGCITTIDQRGAPRVAGLRCDVGAYEFGSIVPIEPLIFKDGFEF